MRLAKVLALLLFGPVLGAFLGFGAGALLLRDDTTGGRSPGDGILVMFWMLIGLAAFSVAAVVLAIRVWRNHSPDREARVE